MRTPLVTIVTPSFNQGRFIRATIESVLSQDYPHIEYIVMDGGSTDNTANVVREYAGRLIWVSEKDRGQAHAINKGFRMAKGEIVAWLNSDDLLLSGAVSHAVRAFGEHPDVGAVYGEGYLIDRDGKVTSRFPATEPFNLWKLVYLSDYILQQTVYFRKTVLDEVGDLDESLYWGMDWDILIRIGKKYPMHYIPEYMGALREHDEAKTFSGGAARFRELARVMRRHGKLRYPPGYITYGLDTLERLWCARVARWTPVIGERVTRTMQGGLSLVMRRGIARVLREAQGWYADGWATTKVKLMLPPGKGRIAIRGTLPDVGPSLQEQEIVLESRGEVLKKTTVRVGDFAILAPFAASPLQGPVEMELRASRFVIPRKIGLGSDSRRLSYKLRGVRWESEAESAREG